MYNPPSSFVAQMATVLDVYFARQEALMTKVLERAGIVAKSPPAKIKEARCDKGVSVEILDSDDDSEETLPEHLPHIQSQCD